MSESVKQANHIYEVGNEKRSIIIRQGIQITIFEVGLFEIESPKMSN